MVFPIPHVGTGVSARALHPRTFQKAGFTLIEMMIALGVVSVILLATSTALQKEAENVTDMQRMSYAERLIQDLFTKIEQRLDFSQGLNSETTLTTGLSTAGTASVVLADSIGFPFQGFATIEPGTGTEEVIEFSAIDPGNEALETLTRGQRGTPAVSHPAGSQIIWEGYSYPIEDQTAPPAGSFDGQTNDLRGPLFFRGNGVGFCYRKPIDPAGTGSFIGPTGIRWGATVGGTDTEDGCSAVVYRAVAQITEANRNFDINGDGDMLDSFDIGRITDLGWNALDPALGTSQLDLVSPIILQEIDNYGGDLDGDGFADPMFLWSPASGRLRIRLFALLGDVRGREVVRRFETVIYLRNGAAE